MSVGKIIQFVCLLLLWLFLCYILITRKGPVAPGMTLLTILISGGIVFIPLYKKYIRDKKN